MSASTPHSGACSCGQVIFDLSDRPVGDILRCSFCGKKYRCLEGETLAPLSEAEISRLDSMPRAAPPEPRPLVSASQSRSVGAPTRARSQSRKPDGPPGGMLPMLGFIIVFNAIAFFAVWMLLPKEDDGLRHAVWDHDFSVNAKAIWPELSALVLGHLMGFAGWSAYVYHLHKLEKLEKKT